MRLRLLIVFALVALLAAACQSARPTVVYIVLSPTPETGVSVEPEAVTAEVQQATEEPSTVVATSTPAPTATPDLFPTPTMAQIQVAEQPFERGRMFWVQPTRQIWVMVVEGEGRGTWRIYEDTFTDGEPEFDPSIVPPEDNLYQPERGFGKLWRENEDVREALGWAVTPEEFGYISRYEYHPGGTVENGQYRPGPGYHVLFSLYEEAFRFNEADDTWQLGRGD